MIFFDGLAVIIATFYHIYHCKVFFALLTLQDLSYLWIAYLSSDAFSNQWVHLVAVWEFLLSKDLIKHHLKKER
jgi:hypothetical protein